VEGISVSVMLDATLHAWAELAFYLNNVQWLLGATLIVLFFVLLYVVTDFIRGEVSRCRRKQRSVITARQTFAHFTAGGEEHEVVELNPMGVDRAL
jgi:hypothetical protein